MKEQADPDITIMLVGNKLDILDKKGSDAREVSTDEAQAFAEKQRILFTETSALADTNVESAFMTLLEKIDENRSKQGGHADLRAPAGHHLKGTQFGTIEEKDEGGCGC